MRIVYVLAGLALAVTSMLGAKAANEYIRLADVTQCQTIMEPWILMRAREKYGPDEYAEAAKAIGNKCFPVKSVSVRSLEYLGLFMWLGPMAVAKKVAIGYFSQAADAEPAYLIYDFGQDWAGIIPVKE